MMENVVLVIGGGPPQVEDQTIYNVYNGKTTEDSPDPVKEPYSRVSLPYIKVVLFPIIPGCEV